jgi:hypothetical protein
VIQELPRVTSLSDILVDGHAVMFGFEQLNCLAVEAKNILQHSMKSRFQQVASLSKQSVQIRTVVLKPGAFAANAETHLSRQRVDTEPLEHLNKIRIGPVVVDDESSINRQSLAVGVHIDRVSVSADVVVGFKDRDLVRRVQQPGGSQA